MAHMKCDVYIPRIRMLGRIFACWHVITKHPAGNILQTLRYACNFLLTGFWPDPCWYYRNFMLFKLKQAGQADDIKEIFDLNLYGLDTALSSPVIVDIGASVGDTLMYFATKYPKAKLFAFEPNPEVFAYIRQNLAHVDISNNTLHLYNKAVSHTAKKRVKFYLANDNLTPSWSSTSGTILPSNNVSRTFPVSSVSFASVIRQVGVIDLLKIDIEGGEYNLISDMLRYRKQIKSFVMEMHNFGTISRRRAMYKAIRALSDAFVLYIKPDYYHTVLHQGFDPQTEFAGRIPDRFGFILYGKRL